jgi:hypothetical protein
MSQCNVFSWNGQLARVEYTVNAYIILVGKSATCVKIEDNIKIDPVEVYFTPGR